jgi:hypothetical protein
MSRMTVGRGRVTHAEDKYADTHARAIEDIHQGIGSPPPINGEMAISALRQMENWGRQSLLRANTKLYCKTHGIQKVKDAFPDGSALLECNCRRPIHQITEERYRSIIQIALTSKIQRNAVKGGFEVVQTEEA